MTGYDAVPEAEHADRMARVLSLPCPQCGAEPLNRCVSPAGHRQPEQHGPRWDAWYAAHPDGGEQR